MTDRDLFAAWQQSRAPELFTQLVARHVDLVYSVARRVTRNDHLAEDVSQEVFLTLARKGAKISPETPLTGWLFTTTRLVALQTLRATSRRRRHESEAAMSQETPPMPDPIWSSIAAEIDKAIGDLPPTDRDAILLRYFNHQSNSEIAAMLAISEEAAKKRVQRAVDALRDLLASRGFATTGVALTAVTLATALTSNAVQAAPPALASSISTSLGSHAATGSLITKGAIMATKIKAGFVIGAAVVAVTASVGTAVYFSRPAVPAGVALPVTVLTSDTPATTEKAPIVTERSRISAGDWQGYRRVSPFEAIQWKGDVPEVQVAGKQYELAAVNDVAAKDMVEFAKGADRDWQKRFNEDFVALLTLMGHAPGATVTLKVKDAQAGAEELLKDVTMTKENRDAIWTARNK